MTLDKALNLLKLNIPGPARDAYLARVERQRDLIQQHLTEGEEKRDALQTRFQDEPKNAALFADIISINKTIKTLRALLAEANVVLNQR